MASKLKYILAVKLGSDIQRFIFKTKHVRAMALHEMSEAGLVDDYAMSETRHKICPECEEIALAYLRNQLLKDGVANYHECKSCGVMVRITKSATP